MATIQTGIELYDGFSNAFNGFINAVNTSITSVNALQRQMNTNINTSSINGVRESVEATTNSIRNLENSSSLNGVVENVEAVTESIRELENSSSLNGVIENIESATESLRELENHASQNIVINQSGGQRIDVPEYSVPEWQSDTFRIFDTSGVERFNSEITSAMEYMSNLSQMQGQLVQNSQNVKLYPENMATDMESLQARLNAINERINTIASNPLNIGSDEASAGLEQLRAQLDMAVQQQNEMNRAAHELDVENANASYLRLSGTIQNVERYLRDNVSEQGAFNRAIQLGANSASTLSGFLQKAVGFFGISLGLGGIKSFLSGSMDLFNDQLNSEIQLSTVLANQLGKSWEDAYEKIVDKAGEIQNRGMFGDEAMIAGAAEISTYIKDPQAISSMMDTLANYAAGMSGGRAVDNRMMTEYATGLSKVISGSYASMTKKGFEFTDAQKAVIDGTATETQLVEALGEKYAEMTDDMQKATVIGNVINEVWGGMYQTMSKTPQNRIQQFQNAFGDLREEIGRRVIPVVANFADIFMKNLEGIKKVFYGFADGVNILGTVLGKVASLTLKTVSFIVDNWSLVAPVVYTATTALTAYYLSLKWTAITTALASAKTAVLTACHYAGAVAQLVYSAATGTLTSATIAQTAAQWGLNAAMLACPVTWILIGIIAIIGAIYLACAVIGKATDTYVSAIGVICGVFTAALAVVGNLFISMINIAIGYGVTFWNFIADFANFFGNVFTDPAGAILKLFFDLIDSVLGMFVSMARSIDSLFGSSLSEKVGNWRKDLEAKVSTNFQNQQVFVQKVQPEDYQIKQRFDYEESFMKGYDFGENISNWNPFDGFKTEAFTKDQYRDLLKEIAGNTGELVDAANVSKERLAYLRDIAEQEAINRYTTASINIDMSGMQNTMNGASDIDGIVSYMSDAVTEAVEVMTEGVH